MAADETAQGFTPMFEASRIATCAGGGFHLRRGWFPLAPGVLIQFGVQSDKLDGSRSN